jgi:hypothetical protein
MFNLGELKTKAPAALRTKEQGAATGASQKYEFMTTSDVVNILGDMNWGIYDAKQQKTKKNPDTTKHLIRFRNNELNWKGENVPEILLVNSHDRTSALTFHVGIFRLICSNGLVVADKTFEKFRVRHMFITFETVSNTITHISQRLPEIFQTIQKFEGTILTPDQQMELALRSIAIRYPEYLDVKTNEPRFDLIEKAMDVKQLLVPQRKEDEGNNLWVTYNRVQEHIIKGGFKRMGTGNKPIQVRELTNIKASLNVNTGLWEVANSYSQN